jgi:hypothetical protein
MQPANGAGASKELIGIWRDPDAGTNSRGQFMTVHAKSSRVVLVMLSLAAAAPCVAGENSSSSGLDIGLRVREEASAADAGLPKYAGAKPYKESDQSSSGANIGFASPLFDLKVVALNLQSSDSPEKVAAFYQQALSRYGDVLECSDRANSKRKSKEGAGRSNELECDADDPGANSVVYKVGTENNQRLVAIKPHGKGTRFSLVHVAHREESER